MELPSRAGPGSGSAAHRSVRLWGIALLAAVPHLIGLRGGFVYDDFRFVRENPGIASLASPGEFFTGTRRASDPPDTDIWRPLRTLGFALQYRVFGTHAAGYHAVSLLLHVLAVRAFLGLLRRVAPGTPSTAAVAGLLFGVHPLTVESVAWISSQGDLLAAVLVFACLRRSLDSVPAAAVLGALALLAKESALPLVLAVPLCHVAARGTAPPRAALRRSARCTVVLGLVTLLYLLARQHVLERGFGGGAGGLGQVDAPREDRLLQAAQNVWLALRLFVVPWRLMVDYGSGVLPVPGWRDALGAAACLAVLGAAAVFVRHRWCALGLGLALLFWLPTSGLVPLKSPTAERFLLLPAAGLAAAAAAMVAGVPPRRLWPCAATLLCLLGARTAWRSHDWRSQQSLFQREVAVNPRSLQAHLGLGAAALERGDLAGARRELRAVVESGAPADLRVLSALHNWAMLEYESGDPGAALELAELCRRRFLERGAGAPPDPRFHKVWVVLGNLYRRGKGPEEAAAVLEEGIALFGRQPALLETLGVVHDQRGDPERAEALYREVLSLAGKDATRCYHLALACLHQGKRAAAREWLREALALDPHHERSAALLEELGALPEPPEEAAPGDR